MTLFVGSCDSNTGSSDLVSLRVFGVEWQDVEGVSYPDLDPYRDVQWMRILATDQTQVLTDTFMQFSPGMPLELPNIPFANGIQITVEGRGLNPIDPSVPGEVLSRGRSPRFTLDPSSSGVSFNVPLARVNQFSATSQPGTAGAVATSLNFGRMGHTTTLLNDGRVLIIGGARLQAGKTGDVTGPGDISEILSSVEVYDPTTGIFYNRGALTIPRAYHSATKLPDGRVLIAGGLNTPNSAVGSFEIFDPDFDQVTTLSVSLRSPRAGHTGTLLDSNGNVLLAGGFQVESGGFSAVGDVEVFCLDQYGCTQPNGDPIVFVDQLNEARFFHTATFVSVGAAGDNEAVVLIGGEGDSEVRSTLETFQLRNPAGIRKGILGEMQFNDNGALAPLRRTRHTANYIDDQKFIHVLGGFSDKAHSTSIARMSSYQVQQETFFNDVEFFMGASRGGHAAVNIPGAGNIVLVFGGWDGTTPLSTAEVLFEFRDPNDGKNYIDRGGVGSLLGPRGGPTGTLLSNGTVLAVGGVKDAGEPTRTGEFFNPL